MLSTKGDEMGGGWLNRGWDWQGAKGGCTEHVELCSCVKMNGERGLGDRQRCSPCFAVLRCGVAERAGEERVAGAVIRRRLRRMLDCLKIVNL